MNVVIGIYRNLLQISYNAAARMNKSKSFSFKIIHYILIVLNCGSRFVFFHNLTLYKNISKLSTYFIYIFTANSTRRGCYMVVNQNKSSPHYTMCGAISNCNDITCVLTRTNGYLLFDLIGLITQEEDDKFFLECTFKI